MNQFMCNRCGAMHGVDKRTTIIKCSLQLAQYCESCVLIYYEEEIMKKHPGFKAVQNKIAKKEGVSKKAAGAIVASAARKASKKAKRKNPRLKKVK